MRLITVVSVEEVSSVVYIPRSLLSHISLFKAHYISCIKLSIIILSAIIVKHLLSCNWSLLLQPNFSHMFKKNWLPFL